MIAKRLKGLFNRHSSALIMMAGAMSIFVSNFLLRYQFTDSEYSRYALLVTYISVISSFGLLGVEQLLVRTSRIGNGETLLDRRTFFTCVILLFFSSLCFSGAYSSIYNEDFRWMFPLSFLVLLAVLCFNVIKLFKMYVLAQAIGNVWKCGVFIWLLFVFMGWSSSVEKFLVIFVFVSLVAFGFVLIPRARFVLADIQGERKSFVIGFFLSLLFITLINNADRFIVERSYGVSVFAQYFFAVNVLVFPASIIGAYIGFKSVVGFKETFDMRELLRSVLISGVLSVLLFAVLVFGYEIIVGLGLTGASMYQFNWLGYFSLAIIFVSRVVYGYYSGAMGALGSAQGIMNANFISFLVLFLVFLFSLYYSMPFEVFLFSYSMLWFSRVLVFHYYLTVSFEKEVAF